MTANAFLQAFHFQRLLIYAINISNLLLANQIVWNNMTKFSLQSVQMVKIIKVRQIIWKNNT
jgi:hypothetical protein